ncbi:MULTISPECIES: hypothetical protein [Pseudomonas]|jgi:hypothetical protein|uniref:Uncharacterized protein n=2 Tax=Pseudomonas TaxID=286 RepID=A0A9X8HHQ5_PSEPU|nr:MULTISPECIES: hypothetical protein [Pseudomonas]MBG8561122.1 hypothetical protein [Pseudomonas qingdaonensis]MDD1956764.1 hypothetical protein [Pseudomonas sp. 8209]MEC6742558.1 hypothetical protein [Pseudomonas qingdaonensis]PPS62256.1 hypothetical protein CR917_15305 [Pseudomonas sp. BRM28]QVL21061.1 hypothetical protein KH389_10970 [Pseudomonas qingdaonensis]
MSENIKYVIKYNLDGERRFDFAVLSSTAPQQVEEALRKLHGEDFSKITDIKVSKAL